MLSLAQYYALGDQVFKGSKVSQNGKKALAWVTDAAEGGDTDALLILTLRYYGIQTSGWIMALPVPADAAKADETYRSAIKIFNFFKPRCSEDTTVKKMVDILPFHLDGRQVRGKSIVAAHGNNPENPVEVECVLSLSGPAPRNSLKNPENDLLFFLQDLR